MENIVCKIEVISCECTTNVVIFIATILNEVLILRNNNIITAFAVRSYTESVIYFFSSVKRKNNIIHLFINIFNLIICEKKSVCCDSEAEILIVLFFDASCILYNTLDNIEIHKWFTAKEIKLEVSS